MLLENELAILKNAKLFSNENLMRQNYEKVTLKLLQDTVFCCLLILSELYWLPF